MTGGVRVEVRITAPETCPVADVSAATGGTGRSVTWSDDPETGQTVEEFVLEAPDESADERDLEVPLETVFADASSEIYRFDRDCEQGCPCVSIERYGYPIANVEASEGSLVITFHVSELDEIRTVLSELRSRYAGMSVERIVRSGTKGADSRPVHIDRNTLTDRQTEVLRTALEMGYFERPREATAGDVADALDINRATFAEHLASAQRKLLPTIVGDSPLG
ncbi:bacterio-opsin activator [Natronorubrum sp. JWXQ-INN-674]|uniref:Bacterio-opsin activator n=1 Tax=Natronorubrum halalkaliphilum TaxID=2691917 RepID=A0A6B0VK40_9EURY|nr:helix-turn-helix domain-containing protein [Natronorubrum halalkaliphilum]MXV61898.1 bacterio-opsin activator [Natronorubrum halalkaliphilum]